ncbi:MAG: hypothetical protein LBP73_08575 [Clostridiales Family XIII bacterium]|jgi:hypothetical protein|nr:hypothetical protein [Clostridiales Family XIII bacterium]
MLNSGSKINYGIRSAKSAERKMMCDLLHLLHSAVPAYHPTQYVGMGSKYFADFLLFHNEFGFEKMISIEGDEANISRYEYNKPLGCIEIKNGLAGTVLPTIDWGSHPQSVVWLDYDGSLERYMPDDVAWLIGNIGIGSVFFVSLNASVSDTAKSKPRIIDGEEVIVLETSKKKEWLKERIGDYCPTDIDEKALTGKNIHRTFKKIFDRMIDEQIKKRNLLSNSQKCVYRQLTFIRYRDGAEMLTFGGILADEAMNNKLIGQKLSDKRIFILEDRDAEPCAIEIPKLTYKEVQELLKRMPLADAEKELPTLAGISEKEIESFSKIYRYYPHFVQAMISN